MRDASWHIFQILTKRSNRLMEINSSIDWPKNVWMGVSVESANYKFRIDHLRTTNANLKFLSLEPLLGPIPNINLLDIQWVIVGGESGPGARPVDGDWVRDLRDQCLVADTPFFFKQWGGIRKKNNGRELDGITWDEMPGIKKMVPDVV